MNALHRLKNWWLRIQDEANPDLPYYWQKRAEQLEVERDRLREDLEAAYAVGRLAKEVNDRLRKVEVAARRLFDDEAPVEYDDRFMALLRELRQALEGGK